MRKNAGNVMPALQTVLVRSLTQKAMKVRTSAVRVSRAKKKSKSSQTLL